MGMFYSVNLWAVLGAAIVSFVLGMLWYSVLFGKVWIKLSGFSKKDTQKAKKQSMTQPMIIGFIAQLITAYVLALFIGVASIEFGIKTAFLIWLGFVAMVMLDIVLWEKKPFNLFVLNAGYRLVALVLMGIIIAAFP